MKTLKLLITFPNVGKTTLHVKSLNFKDLGTLDTSYFIRRDSSNQYSHILSAIIENVFDVENNVFMLNFCQFQALKPYLEKLYNLNVLFICPYKNEIDSWVLKWKTRHPDYDISVYRRELESLIKYCEENICKNICIKSTNNLSNIIKELVYA